MKTIPRSYALLSVLIMSHSWAWTQEQVPLDSVIRNEIVSLAERQVIQSAFAHIKNHDDQTQSELIVLTEIPAPPFKEEKRAIQFKEMLEEAGIDSSWIDEEGNVIGLRKGSSGDRSVGLDAHLDTVFPEGTDVKVRVSNDTMYAPGIGDDTRGLAMLLAILRAMNSAGIETVDDILFIGSVGEEGIGDLRGVKHLFRPQATKIDAWIAVDGGQIGRVNNKGLGSYRYRITYRGPGGHSWGAFGLVNPHHAIGKCIAEFTVKADQFTSHGLRTSYNVGRMGGGTSVNSVPFESWMEVDMRSESPIRLDSLENLLLESVQIGLDDQNKRKRLGADLEVDIDKIGNRPSGELSADLPLVQRALAATAFFGKRPRLTRGSTNSNIPIAMGIPAVTIGRGGVGANGHSLDEWWYNAEGFKAIQLGLLLVVAEAGLKE